LNHSVWLREQSTVLLTFVLVIPNRFTLYQPINILDMKKTWLTLLTICAAISLSQAQIVISEIMYNPPESGNDSLEYVEIYNSSNAGVNLDGWSMVGVELVFSSVTIAPGQYLVISKSAAALQNVLGATSIQWTTGALSNNGEVIKVLDGTGATIDEVTYANAAPWPVEAAGVGASLVLCDPNSDNSLAVSWQAATTSTGVTLNGKLILANPGAASGCTGSNQLSATNDQTVTASGQAKTINVLANDLIPNPITTFNTISNPQHGTATVNANNSITYTPNAGYCGQDGFSYRVCDANTCDTANVTIQVNCYTPYTVAAVTTENPQGVADSLNVYTELTGTVYGVNLRPNSNNQNTLLFTIIDGSGAGIAVSTLNKNFGYTVTEKDIVTVRGKIGQFNGQTEIQPDTLWKVSSGNPLVTPAVVFNHSEATESQLIRINNVHLVDPATWTTGMGTSGFTCAAVSDDHPNDTITIRIDRDVETYNSPAPPEPFNITGIGGQFDPSSPFSTGYQILPRYNNDISTIASGTHQADFSAQVSLTPNPASDILTLRTEVGFDRVTILNANGQLVKTITNPALTEQINVSNLPTGTYFVRIEKNNGVWSTRFVKM
jgi:hypothetical protein